MKKTTLIIMIFMSYFGFAQNTTTGVVQFTYKGPKSRKTANVIPA